MNTISDSFTTDVSVASSTGRQVSRRSLLRTAGSVATVGVAAATIGAGQWMFGGAGVASAAAPRAGAGVKPVAANTGVIPGSRLTVHNGDITITKAGTTIKNLDIRGNVHVKASNVSILNCMIRGVAVAPTSGSHALIEQFSDRNTGLGIHDCTLLAQKPNQWTTGIQGSNMTIRRCNISTTVDGVDSMGMGNVLVDSCYLHNGGYFTPSATHSDNQTHDDGIQVTSGNNVVFNNNNILAWNMSCFMINQGRNSVSGMRITGNWLDGGSATINLNSSSGSTMRPVIANNRFGRSRKNTYMILAAGAIDRTHITGNVYDDNGTPVTIHVK